MKRDGRALIWALCLLLLISCRATEKGPASPASIFGGTKAELAEPINADRPGFADGPDTVPRGRFHLELGYTFARDDSQTQQGFPEALLRAGIMDNVELRLGWDGAAIENGESLGGSDVSVGARWHLLDQDGLIPSLGATFTLSLPTGGKRNTSDEVEPDFLLAWSYDLSDLLSVGGHVTAGAPADDNGHHFFQTTAAVSVGFSLSDKVGSYVEYFIIHPAERHSDSEHNVGAGLTYLLTDNIQLDLQGTYGLNERATEFSIGGGIALRW